MHLLQQLLPLLIALASVGWVLWRWLKSSDEPWILIVRWIISAVVLGFVFINAARARDEFSKIVALLIGCVGGIVMTLVWRQRFCEFVGDQFAALYTGGSEQADPKPFYSIALAKRKRGQYLEAIAAIRAQLERFPSDFEGRMLLAEIQAENLKDVAAAADTVQEILAQEGHPPKNVAYALTRQADWFLMLNHDREAARAALEQIVAMLPETEQAQMALQRIAHLAPPEMLAEKQAPHRMAVPHLQENIGLIRGKLDVKAPEEDPAMAAAKYVQHLEAFPYDNDAREKLALLYARFYQRMDLATDQLEQLISFPNQPAKEVVRWLNLLTDLQVESGTDPALPKQTLQRIIDLYPKAAAAENARNRMARLNLELRSKQEGQAVKLGSYEQNIGLKRGRPNLQPPH